MNWLRPKFCKIVELEVPARLSSERILEVLRPLPSVRCTQKVQIEVTIPNENDKKLFPLFLNKITHLKLRVSKNFVMKMGDELRRSLIRAISGIKTLKTLWITSERVFVVQEFSQADALSRKKQIVEFLKNVFLNWNSLKNTQNFLKNVEIIEE